MRLLHLALLSACSLASPGEAPPSPADSSDADATAAGQAPAGAPADDADASTVTATEAIAAAIAHPDRPADDRERDPGRAPEAILALLEVKPGDTVADLMAGRGYYTELLARTVGREGTVYAQNNAYVVERFADEALTARLARPGLQHVVRLDRELEDLGLPEGQLDAAFMGLFYHDSVWMGADRDAMNEAIFAALKPGGVFVVTDHHAAPGKGVEHVKTLHRIEKVVVQREIEAAGFVLDGESERLRNPRDDRTRNVFEDGLRGKTDRFVLRFRKPAP